MRLKKFYILVFNHLRFVNFRVERRRRDIKQRYPGAKIEGLEKQPLVRVVSEEEKEQQKPEKKQEKKRLKETKKKKKQLLIRIIE